MTLRIFDIAAVVLIFNGALLVVNELEIFGPMPFMADPSISKTDFTGAVPTEPGLAYGESESSESFLRRGINAIFGENKFFAALHNLLFVGSHLNGIMITATGLELPQTFVTLLDLICGFIYSLAGIQIFLRLVVE